MFWNDPWLLDEPLARAFPRLFRVAASKVLPIAQCWSEEYRRWDLLFRRNLSDPEVEEWASLSNLLASVAPSTTFDRRVCGCSRTMVFSQLNPS